MDLAGLNPALFGFGMVPVYFTGDPGYTGIFGLLIFLGLAYPAIYIDNTRTVRTLMHTSNVGSFIFGILTGLGLRFLYRFPKVVDSVLVKERREVDGTLRQAVYPWVWMISFGVFILVSGAYFLADRFNPIVGDEDHIGALVLVAGLFSSITLLWAMITTKVQEKYAYYLRVFLWAITAIIFVLTLAAGITFVVQNTTDNVAIGAVLLTIGILQTFAAGTMLFYTQIPGSMHGVVALKYLVAIPFPLVVSAFYDNVDSIRPWQRGLITAAILFGVYLLMFFYLYFVPIERASELWARDPLYRHWRATLMFVLVLGLTHIVVYISAGIADDFLDGNVTEVFYVTAGVGIAMVLIWWLVRLVSRFGVVLTDKEEDDFTIEYMEGERFDTTEYSEMYGDDTRGKADYQGKNKGGKSSSAKNGNMRKRARVMAAL